MSEKLIKKYALVSTSFWDGDNWKSFHILRNGLSEEDVLRIKHNFDEYLRLWKECYQKEADNTKNGVSQDLRTELVSFLNKIDIENNYTSISDDYNLWSEVDLIIENFKVV